MSDLPLHVVHVTTARTWRGGEQQVLYLCERLAAEGVAQTVVCAAGSELQARLPEHGIATVALARRASIDPFFARGLARVCTLRLADVIHAHDPHAHTASVLAKALFSARGELVVHRRVEFPVRDRGFSRWKYRHPSVRRYLCVSRAVAAVLAPVVGDPARLAVVHSGIDPRRFAAGGDGRLRRELALPAHVPLVGNVAALTADKDPFTFVSTAARLAARGSDARFVLAGDGALRAGLEAFARDRGVADRLAFVGFRRDVARLLPELDVFLFTSRKEGLGTAVLDAFAARVPVVATAAGGIPEMVADGETGLLAPIGDADALADRVAMVLGDPALRARLVAGAARRVEDFTVERLGARVLATYREIVGEGR